MMGTRPTLAVELGHGAGPADAVTLGQAYLRHALASPSWPATMPSSRELRATLPDWTRARYAAATRVLAPTCTVRPDGTRHVRVTVPTAGPSGPLHASPPGRLYRDTAYVRVWLDDDRFPDHHQFQRDLAALGPVTARAGRLLVDLGEATDPHPWILHDLLAEVAAGHVPAPEFIGRQFAIVDAWRAAYEGQVNPCRPSQTPN